MLGYSVPVSLFVLAQACLMVAAQLIYTISCSIEFLPATPPANHSFCANESPGSASMLECSPTACRSSNIHHLYEAEAQDCLADDPQKTSSEKQLCVSYATTNKGPPGYPIVCTTSVKNRHFCKALSNPITCASAQCSPVVDK